MHASHTQSIRKSWLIGGALALAMCTGFLGACGSNDEAKKGESTPTIGFAQIGSESSWRTANTEDIKKEAEKRKINLKFTDAQGQQPKEVSDISSFIAQHVDVIAFSPITSTGWDEVLKKAKDAGIPVIITDRRVDVKDDSLYVAHLGSDAVEEGRRAARWLTHDAAGKPIVIAILDGQVGSAPAIDRAKGFAEIMKDYKGGYTIFAEQTGEFRKDEGKKVMETFLKRPGAEKINYVFGHNDDMAIGAIQALTDAGRKPGDDVKIVSIDGVRGAFEEMGKGHLNCTVECLPLIGSQLFDLVEKVMKKEKVDKEQIVKEDVYVLIPADGAPDGGMKADYVHGITKEEAEKLSKTRAY